jgi:aspartate beta-hydroxylase
MPELDADAQTNDLNDFTCAIVERLMQADGLDTDGVAIVEAGLRIGQRKPQKPPNPWQQPARWYPGLTAQPWHDPAAFSWVAQLEAAYPEIREEAIAAYYDGRFRVNPLSGQLGDGSWHEYRLYSEGRRSAHNCAACPRTAKVIDAIPGATSAGLVYFAALKPRGHVRPHWGPHNARLRCQLGLVIPDNCELRVGPETRRWQEGRVLIFDDSFEHEVFNRSNETRIVLVLDIWHPDLSPAQAAAIRCSELPIIAMAAEVAADWVRMGSIPRLHPPVADHVSKAAPT